MFAPSRTVTVGPFAVGNVRVTVAALAPTVPCEFCALKEKL